MAKFRWLLAKLAEILTRVQFPRADIAKTVVTVETTIPVVTVAQTVVSTVCATVYTVCMTVMTVHFNEDQIPFPITSTQH